MIIDCFTYNGEVDILKIRLNILDEFVDEFVIVEARHTFSGKPKKLYYKQQKEKFKKWHKKIRYYIVDENDPVLWFMAQNSPNTVGAKHWKREFVQKESIKKALKHLDDEDIVYIGDVDEIWTPHIPTGVEKLKLHVFTYFLNNASNEEFWGTVVGRWKDMKDECLNELRSDISLRTQDYHGWHFTSMGGLDELKRKLDDSYTEESYYNEVTKAYLDTRYRNNRDFLGRDFKFHESEDLPEYILKNKEKYKHLWRYF